MGQRAVGLADRFCACRHRRGHSSGVAGAAGGSGIPRAISRRPAVRAGRHRRLSGVAAGAALPEPSLHGVHHPLRYSGSRRPSAPVLETRLHARHRVVSLSEGRSQGADLDRQGRLGDPAGLAGHSRHPAFHRAGPLVAFLVRPAVDHQRRRRLRAAVLDRPVAEAGARHMGGVPERGLDRAAIPVAHFPRR